MTDRPPAVHETHVSYVFLLGDRAYKLKKPVRYDFVDQSTREARERICRREVELNRRLAPDVYLGVLEIRDGSGDVIDHLVEMRRMPDGRRLSQLIRDGADVDACLRQLTHDLVAFHASADTSPEISASAGAMHVRTEWQGNIREIRPFADRGVIDGGALDRVEADAYRYIDGRQPLFSSRTHPDHAKDGHGDLLADDIFCLEDGPRALDCIEFRDDLRWGDVVADIGFLAMDLERLGAPEDARRLIDRYREFSGETFPDSLADHYVAFRALIRAKVACLKHAQTDDPSDAERAGHLLALCARRLGRARVRLVLVGGLPGTGKSTLAAGLSERLPYALLRSDEIRKDITGTPHTGAPRNAFGEGIYDEASTDRTYEEMIRRAHSLLATGTSVILDASWLRREHRATAARAAAATSSDLIELRCDVAMDIASERMGRRRSVGTDVSDADEAVARAMAEHADAWDQAETLDTTDAPEDIVSRAVSIVTEDG